MNLFIDASIFLFFYHLSNADLEELDKLRVLLRSKEIKLWMPEQVSNEWHRKRDEVIATALKGLRDQRLSASFPPMSKGYPEHDVLRDLQRDYVIHHAKLIDQITKDAMAKELKADKTIESLIGLATSIPITDPIYRSAKKRHECGNPPGKAGSVGDALNWEALLFAIPKSEHIYIVTDDNDYSSALDKAQFSPFLLHEWTEQKESDVFFYKGFERRKASCTLWASHQEPQERRRCAPTPRWSPF
jgi:hypothetical protein